jgi:hypothetical protein
MSRFPPALGTTASTRTLLYEMLTSLPQFEWHRWFAWRPVFLQTRTGTRSLVWLHYVERHGLNIWGRYGFIGGQGPVRGTTLARRDDPIRTSLRHCRSLFPGNGILRGRDSGVEKARHIQPIVSRDKAPVRKPTNSALFARHREISVCMGLRGGAGRTRTSNQTIISSWLGKFPKCRALRYERFVSPIELQ